MSKKFEFRRGEIKTIVEQVLQGWSKAAMIEWWQNDEMLNSCTTYAAEFFKWLEKNIKHEKE